MTEIDSADVALHDDDCGLKNFKTCMPCSCCKGALTFDEARLVKEKLTGGRAVPNTKKRNFEGVPATACWGIHYSNHFLDGTNRTFLSVARSVPVKQIAIRKSNKSNCFKIKGDQHTRIL